VPLIRLRAFADAGIEDAAPAIGRVRLRFELESQAARAELDRLIVHAEPAIALEARRWSAGISIALERMPPLVTDM